MMYQAALQGKWVLPVVAAGCDGREVSPTSTLGHACMQACVLSSELQGAIRSETGQGHRPIFATGHNVCMQHVHGKDPACTQAPC